MPERKTYDAFSLADFDDSGWEVAAKEPWELPVIDECRTFPEGFGRSWPKFMVRKWLLKADIRLLFR